MSMLSKELNTNELMYMRDQGMSNREIAKALDVSPATIYNWIGKQPKEMSRRNFLESIKRRSHADAQDRKIAMAALSEICEMRSNPLPSDEDTATIEAAPVEPVSIVELPTATGEAEDHLRVVRKTTVAEGSFARYYMNAMDSSVVVKFGAKKSVRLTGEEVTALAKEFSELATLICA